MRRLIVSGVLGTLLVLGAPTAAFARDNHCHYGWDNWGYNYRGSHYHYGSWRYDHGPENCGED
jgi:hypothetical protein